MNLVIDIGNTRFKYAFFEEKGMTSFGFEVQEMYRKIEQGISQGVKIDVFLSGSGKIDAFLRARLKNYAAYWLEVASGPLLPVGISYKTPETLGFDRVAVCVGACNLFPRKNLLVIDSGTALTYNYVDEHATFLGGNISPGQEIRFRSLHLFTEKLPYIKPVMNYGGCGRTTSEALLNGVMDGILYEVEGYVREFRKKYPDGQVVITGGNSLFLKDKLGPEAYFEIHLGFIGLNEILEYNKNHNET